MRRLDSSVPSASSAEVGEVQVALGRWAAAWRGRSGLRALTLSQATLLHSIKSETQLILVVILLFFLAALIETLSVIGMKAGRGEAAGKSLLCMGRVPRVRGWASHLHQHGYCGELRTAHTPLPFRV